MSDRKRKKSASSNDRAADDSFGDDDLKEERADEKSPENDEDEELEERDTAPEDDPAETAEETALKAEKMKKLEWTKHHTIAVLLDMFDLGVEAPCSRKDILEELVQADLFKPPKEWKKQQEKQNKPKKQKKNATQRKLKPQRIHVAPPQDPYVLRNWRAPTREELQQIIPESTPLIRDLADLVADYFVPGPKFGPWITQSRPVNEKQAATWQIYESKYEDKKEEEDEEEEEEEDDDEEEEDDDYAQELISKLYERISFKEFKRLFEKHLPDVNAQSEDDSSTTMICCAAGEGDLRMTQYLLKNGASNVESGCRAGTTLDAASHCPQVFEYLLYHHNSLPPDNPGNPVDRLCDIPYVNDGNALSQAARLNQADIVRELVLVYGMDPNSSGALDSAIASRSIESVRVLVEECGAEVGDLEQLLETIRSSDVDYEEQLPLQQALVAYLESLFV